MKCPECEWPEIADDAQSCPKCGAAIAAAFQPPTNVKPEMMNYPNFPLSSDLAERAKDFVGREWILKDLHEWLGREKGSRFFLIKGEPGSGKTAMSVRLVQLSQGLVSPPDNLPGLQPGWLSAAHFCDIRRSATSHTPNGMIAQLGTQLSARYEICGLTLVEKSSEGLISMRNHQKVYNNAGQVIGYLINELNVGPMPAEDAFAKVIMRPLQALFQEEPIRQVIILVDGLDESLTFAGPSSIMSLLAGVKEDLPEGVRFIITSRPEKNVERLLEDYRPDKITLSEGRGLSESQNDIGKYVQTSLAAKEHLAAKLAPELSPDAFREKVEENAGRPGRDHHAIVHGGPARGA
jgi:hypothetical protein